ncbi:pleckstrin homology domain-containing family B member 2-like [Glandiceps talaboti]
MASGGYRQQFVTKAGWMHRQSEILKRWKKQWCVLYSDGGLACYSDQSMKDRDMVIRMNIDAQMILSAFSVRDVKPPENRTYDCLIAIKTCDGTTSAFCAENPDDCKAWSIALEQMKGVVPPPPQPRPQTVHVPHQNVTVVHHRGVPPPPAYRATTSVTTTTYPGGQTVVVPGNNQTMYYPGNTTYMVQSAPGQAVYYDYPNQPNQTIIVDRRRRYRDGDFATGALLGVAAGAMLMGPMLWY